MDISETVQSWKNGMGRWWDSLPSLDDVTGKVAGWGRGVWGAISNSEDPATVASGAVNLAINHKTAKKLAAEYDGFGSQLVSGIIALWQHPGDFFSNLFKKGDGFRQLVTQTHIRRIAENYYDETESREGAEVLYRLILGQKGYSPPTNVALLPDFMQEQPEIPLASAHSSAGKATYRPGFTPDITPGMGPEPGHSQSMS